MLILGGRVLMVGKLYKKMLNFLMPPQNERPSERDAEQDGKVFAFRSKNRKIRDEEQMTDNRPQLTVHSQSSLAMKIFVEEPVCFDDAQKYADFLKANAVVFINYKKVNIVTQQRISDFMNGVCYTLGGSVQQVSEDTALYACSNVDFDKILFSYSVPAYVRV
jgi:cell division inhibitor SepF